MINPAKIRGVVLFEQPNETTYVTTSFFLSFHWSKTMEREK